MYFSAVMPAREQLAQLQAQSVHRQRAGGAQGDGLRTAAMRGAEQLEQFNRNFPPLADAPALVLKLHKIAAQNGIALETGEYQLMRDRDTSVTRYQVTLPLRGTYWQVRLFIAQLLDEVPASTLEEISMKRESVGARAVETRVRLTIYLAGDGGVPR
jgi:Tfp pilus assembly protein PilO